MTRASDDAEALEVRRTMMADVSRRKLADHLVSAEMLRADTLSRLRRYGYTSYDKYLQSPEWRARKTRLKLAKSCWVCNARKDLHAHHCSYERICRERREDIVVLCDGCHRGVHALSRRHGIRLEDAHVEYKRRGAWRRRKRGRRGRKSRAGRRKRGIAALLSGRRS